MKYIVTAEEMRSCEEHMIKDIGLPSLVLMERAALGVTEVLLNSGFDLSRILIVCGGGNNGADGIAAARLLHMKNLEVAVLLAPAKNISQENQTQQNIAKKIGVHFCDKADFQAFTLIIDALFGIGLSRAAEGIYADLINRINSSGVPVLAVDIPSGLSADGLPLQSAVIHAKKTVTFAYNKRGLLLYPGADYAGEICVTDIGLSDKFFSSNKPAAFAYELSDLKLLPARKPHSHKGSYGKVLVAAGSPGMAGAAYFSAEAAYRSGVGLVKLLSAAENHSVLQSLLPEAVILKKNADNILDETVNADAVVFGPGSGLNSDAAHILEQLLRHVRKTLIIDGDGLTLVANRPELLKESRANIVITPHLGEMSRLTGLTAAEISSDLSGTASRFAVLHNVVCVLKDSRSVTADKDGRLCINISGNNGMATAGSGDVLTGIIAGLAAQGLAPFEAASLGAYVHGLAGGSAAIKVGFHALMARDIIAGISEVFFKSFT